MAIYEYRCSVCERKVAVLVRSGGAEPACPECGSVLTDKLFSVPNLLSSRVDRSPELTCCRQGEHCEAPQCSCGDGCRSH